MKHWQPLKLKDLSKDTQKIYEILNEESDLACVLIGTSYLSELLASTIKVSFIESSVSEKILDPQRGTIGGFSNRADLAYCLGLINKNIYQDLIRVAEIRNRFAHKHLALDFRDSGIRTICEELRTWRPVFDGEEEKVTAELSPKEMQIRARNQFKIFVVLMGSRIHVDALTKEHRVKNHK